jgi:peptidoglycan-N-acetylglucosamine deacetylase
MPLTVTFDLEDNRRSFSQEPRFVAMSERFMEFVEQREIVATVFVVGEVAREHGALIRRIADRGHEIGLHSLRHVALEEVGPDRLEAELREGKDLLEQAAQCDVHGFRAPIFSLTPSTAWAVESIAAAGFSYSSSVLPAVSPLHGWPGAPRRPFRWQNGLLELPCPVIGLGRMMVPYLGGIYLRYVPAALARAALRRTGPDAVAWSYSHPYDIDKDQPFFVPPYAGWLTSRILQTRRGATLPALASLISAAGAGPPLAAIAASLSEAELPTVQAA